MTGRAVQLRFGDVDVLVETRPIVGTEPTSTLDKATGQVVDALQGASLVIRAVAESMVGTVSGLIESRVTRPDKVEVELGLGFSVKGNVIVASGQADATLKVKLIYDTATSTKVTEESK